MTLSVVSNLRAVGGKKGLLESLRAQSTEAVIANLAEKVSDPEWEAGPASLVCSHLTGPNKYVLAEMANGDVVRVAVERTGDDWSLGDVEEFADAEKLPSLEDASSELALEAVDAIMAGNAPVATLVALIEAVGSDPKLARMVELNNLAESLAPKKLWYIAQMPAQITEGVEPFSVEDRGELEEHFVARSGEILSLLSEDPEVPAGLGVVIEAVVKDAESMVNLLRGLGEAENSRVFRKTILAAPMIDRALDFVKTKLESEDAEGSPLAESQGSTESSETEA